MKKDKQQGKLDTYQPIVSFVFSCKSLKAFREKCDDSENIITNAVTMVTKRMSNQDHSSNLVLINELMNLSVALQDVPKQTQRHFAIKTSHPS